MTTKKQIYIDTWARAPSQTHKHTCTHVRMGKSMHMWNIYAHTLAPTRVHTPVNACTWNTYLHIHIDIYLHRHMSNECMAEGTHTQIHTRTCLCKHIHAHTTTCTHTHTQTYTCMHTNICAQGQTNTHNHTHTCSGSHVYMCMHQCMTTHGRKYKLTSGHSHTHACTHAYAKA